MNPTLSIPGKHTPYLMAHRGNNVLCPENTIPAFHQAIADGADMIETDIHLTKDGQIVCIHDAAVDRTTNGSGLIREMAVDEIKKLNASAKHKLYHQPTQIPLLSELLSVLPAPLVVALEIKTNDIVTEQALKSLFDLLDSFRISSRTLFLSFDLDQLKKIKQTNSQAKVGLISMARLNTPDDVDVFGVFYPVLYIHPRLVRKCHRKGQLFCPLDPTPDKRLAYYKKLNCDAILSDNARETRKAIDELWDNH